MYQSKSPRIGLCQGILIGLVASIAPAFAQNEVFDTITELALPVAPGAREPSLFAMSDGRILMSWTEPADKGFAVKTAIGNAAGWSDPRIVAQSDRLFVNWSDFPSVAAFADGTLAVQWLMKRASSPYDYDLNIALSSDEGRSWGKSIVPHRDTSRGQHGFATLLPLAHNRLVAIWLDGRAYDARATGTAENALADAMQLRTTTITPDGRMSDDMLLDARTCSCCQTSGALTKDGGAIVVYRDRTKDEVRDISVVRLVDNVWSEPETIHADDWEIDGCPINGPAIDSNGDMAVVAWFTGARDVPVVNLAFSGNSGKSFGRAMRIDMGDPAGRVDVLQLDDGSALVSWVEWSDAGEALLVCRAVPANGCDDSQVITLNEADGTINFPRMVLAGDKVFIAWTQPLSGQAAYLDGGVTIRMVLATF